MKNTLSLLCLLLGQAPFFAFGQHVPTGAQPFVLGHSINLFSEILQEQRTLNVYLPEGYHPDSVTTYPVIYLLDGSADEDFIHTVGLVQFANFPWVNTLPPSIVVGIANVDRRRDYTFPTRVVADSINNPTNGGSAKFIAFIEKELQPYLRQHYRTNGIETIIGQSLGGLLATELLFKKPMLFDQYIIVSPSLWWDDESLLKEKALIAPTPFAQKTQVYIAVGKEGKVMERDARSLYKQLKGYKNKQLQVTFDYFPAQNHADIFHIALYRAFLASKKV